MSQGLKEMVLHLEQQCEGLKGKCFDVERGSGASRDCHGCLRV